MTRVDAVVVGQGLAGTAVAWHLLWRGARLLVVDREDPDTASRVAAGLLTPVTGGRFARTWRWDEFRPAAVAFYRRVEAETGEPLLAEAGAVRLFAGAADRATFDRRAGLLAGLVAPPDPPPDPDWFAAADGGFAMPLAARLRAERYLDASRRHFARLGAYTTFTLDPARDVEPAAGGVRLPRLGVVAEAVLFCQGFAAAGNPWCPGLRLTPMAGEVLTVRVPELAEERTVHRGVWLAPAGDGLFRAGATYGRGQAGAAPTAAGREELCERLGELLRRPFEVVEHRAGVRPVADGHRPVVGRHGRVGWLNGLGSKGALVAPLIAGELVEAFLTPSPPKRGRGGQISPLRLHRLYADCRRP